MLWWGRCWRRCWGWWPLGLSCRGHLRRASGSPVLTRLPRRGGWVPAPGLPEPGWRRKYQKVGKGLAKHSYPAPTARSNFPASPQPPQAHRPGPPRPSGLGIQQASWHQQHSACCLQRRWPRKRATRKRYWAWASQGIRCQWCWAEGQASAYQTGRGHLRHCGSECLSAALRAAWRASPRPHLRGRAVAGQDSLPLLCRSRWWVGQVREKWTLAQTCVCACACVRVHVCVSVCRAPCGREGRGKGEWSCYGGQPHTSTSGRGHKYPISGVTGTKLEPPLYFWCSGAPFSAESVPLGPGGRGLGVCTQAEIQNSIWEKEQRVLESQGCFLLAVWLWMNYFTLLSLSFLA